MTYDIAQHELRPQPIISVRKQVEQEQLPSFVGSAFQELYAHLGRHGVPPRGEPFVVYHAFGPDSIDAEACLPVPTVVRGTEDIAYCELPAVTVVQTLHVGPYSELGQAYQALTEWLNDHGFEAAGPVRERYLNEPGPEVPPSAYRTIVQFPITPAAVRVG